MLIDRKITTFILSVQTKYHIFCSKPLAYSYFLV